jgi:hypothetical protein
MRSLKRSRIKMKTVITISLLIFGVSLAVLAQPERADIIEKKIKSIKKTIFKNADSANKEIFQNYYTVNGDDSLESFNGTISFKYIAKFDDKARTDQLIRYDINGKEDEWHKYKYNKDGSYSIEKIAQGAGRISLAQYNKKNWLMEEEIDASYTMIYQRNAAGKTQKILVKEKDKTGTEVVAAFYFDKNGFATKGEGTTEGGNIVYFKYNDKDLANEVKTVFGDKKTKQTTETILLEYEFYGDKN